MRLALALFLLLVIVFAYLEVKRWKSPAYVAALTPGSRARRLTLALLLLIIGGMCFGGTYFPQPGPHLPVLLQAVMMLYWGVVLLFALAVPVLGYIEAKETMMSLNRQLAAVYRDTLAPDTNPAKDQSETNA